MTNHHATPIAPQPGARRILTGLALGGSLIVLAACSDQPAGFGAFDWDLRGGATNTSEEARQATASKPVPDANGISGKAVNTLVSGGCIVSGSHVAHTVLFSEVRIHSFCHVEEAVLLPNVTVGRGCRLRRVVVDRNCQLPEGLVVGEDPVLDAKRFERTESGVVLITKQMLKDLVL